MSVNTATMARVRSGSSGGLSGFGEVFVSAERRW